MAKMKDTIKTAGVIATAAFALNSCEQKNGTEYDDMAAVQYKTDSVANTRPEYKTTSRAIDLYAEKIQNCKDANKKLLRLYASGYLLRNIGDVRLRNFMLDGLDNRVLIDVSDFDTDEIACEIADVDQAIANKMRFIRRNHRWYNDLLMYLSDKYTEKQLLKSDFFNVINAPELKKQFVQNTQQLEKLNSVSATASARQNRIYEDLWQQNIKKR